MVEWFKNIFNTITNRHYLKSLLSKLEQQQLISGQILCALQSDKKITSVRDAEFNVFSQYGDDGIIQYLIQNINSIETTFIEFGVEDYKESNTRFLLMNNYWRGLVIDANVKNICSLKKTNICWQYNLTVSSHFVTKHNINQIFVANGFSGEIGLLSIDVDGNDYWIWEAITAVSPAIVIVEYNSVFGIKYSITIPYTDNFYRTTAHYSNIYWGASLKALNLLAEKKGYLFVGCNSAGNNAYFVRNDKMGSLPVLKLEAGFSKAIARESRDEDGNLNFKNEEEKISIISHMQVWDIEKERLITIKELFNEC